MLWPPATLSAGSLAQEAPLLPLAANKGVWVVPPPSFQPSRQVGVGGGWTLGVLQRLGGLWKDRTVF